MSMTREVRGIHHVTAIAGDAQRNLDFYMGPLGMRLVKVNVNQDDPGTYHFYFGDESGSPGSILTFFPHAGGYTGKKGAGQASAVGLAIPSGSLDFWIDRLAAEAISFDMPGDRFGERMISLSDPDGLTVELIESEDADGVPGWAGGPVLEAHVIRGIHSVTLEHASGHGDAFLGEQMGFLSVAEEYGRVRYRTGTGVGSIVDVVPNPTIGRVAVGSIHHVAFRVAGSDGQQEWLRYLGGQDGIHTSGIVERAYFRSLYFREPGGVLFEIATDGPGFTIDEELEELGSGLCLPPWLESRRAEIERVLPPIRYPQVVAK